MRAIFIVSEGEYPNVSTHYTLAGYSKATEVEQALTDMDLVTEAMIRKPQGRDKTQIKKEIDQLLDEFNRL